MGAEARAELGWSAGEALVELLELVLELLREGGADGGVVGLELRQLGAPGVGFHLEELGDVALLQVEPAEIEAARGGDAADGGVDAVVGPGRPLDDPLQHPAVLAEA